MARNYLVALILILSLSANVFLVVSRFNKGSGGSESGIQSSAVESLRAGRYEDTAKKFEASVRRLGCASGQTVLSHGNRFAFFMLLADHYADAGDCAAAEFCMRMAGAKECRRVPEEYSSPGTDYLSGLDGASRGTAGVGYRNISGERGIYYPDLLIRCDKAEKIEEGISKRCSSGRRPPR